MFAYCGSDPANYSDPSGHKRKFWHQLFEDNDPGYIHRAVQAHILLTYNIESVMYKKEFYLPGIGRADIVCLETGEMWEVKHGGSTVDSFQNGILNATDQLRRYIRGGCDFSKGAAGQFSGSFVIAWDSNLYLVTYCTPAQGAIIYTLGKLADNSRVPDYIYAPKSLYSTESAYEVNPVGAIGSILMLYAILEGVSSLGISRR